jgi:hypothetical protein
MKDRDTRKIHKKGELRITQENVIIILNRIIDRDGVEKGIEALKDMNDWFCGEEGWAETSMKAQDLIVSRRKLEQQKELQQRVEIARAFASGGINMQNSQCQVFTGAVIGSTFEQGGQDDGKGKEIGVA